MQVDEAHLADFKSQGGFQVERAMAIRGERRTVTKPRWLKRGYYFVKRRPYRSPSARLRLKTGSKNHGRLSESSSKRKRFERKINRWGGAKSGCHLRKKSSRAEAPAFLKKPLCALPRFQQPGIKSETPAHSFAFYITLAPPGLMLCPTGRPRSPPDSSFAPT